MKDIKKRWEEFRWLEFCPSKQHYDWMMTYDEMLKEREKEQYAGNELFISRYAYDRDNPYSGPLLSNLYFDFDDEINLNRAKADCLAVAEHFNEAYKIPLEALKIRFTGGKGFSLEVPFQFFNVKPTSDLDRVWKRMATRIEAVTKVKTLDKSVYHRRCLWRLTNSRHASGCYKIPLSYQELKGMSVDEVKRLAAKGRREYLYVSDMRRDYEPVPALESWFKTVQTEIRKEQKEQVKRLTKKLGKETPTEFDPTKIWHCVEQRIKKGVDTETERLRREPTAFSVAVSLHRLGASDTYIKSRLEEFAENCNPEFPLDRYNEFDHIISMVHTHEYSTHCFTPCFSTLCDKAQCWLFKEVKISLADIDFSKDVKLRVVDGAGGFNEDFTYETFYVQSEYGKIAWILVWFDGVKAGMNIIADERKITEFTEIKGVKYKVRNLPTLYLETLWDKKSAYQFVQTLEAPEPSEVYERVEACLRYFADCDDGTDVTEGRYVFGVCWTIGTYFYEMFHFFPYNLVRGFMLSGKTTWMLSCVYQSYHGHAPIVNPSPASIFRTIETAKPTLGIDNAERLYESKQTDEETKKIVEMLDVGAYAGGKVPRVEGSARTGRYVKLWGVYCPKGITTVKGVAPSLVSRSVPMDMIETSNPEYGDRRRELWHNPRDSSDVKAAEIRANRNDLYRLRLKLWRQMQDVSRTLRSDDYGIKSRDWDIWLPILSVAKLFCPDKIPALQRFAEEVKSVMEEYKTSEEKEGMLRVLTNIYKEDGWYSLKGIAMLLKIQMEWETCSSKTASRILKDLGFKKRKRAGAEGRVHALINKDTLQRQAQAIGLSLASEVLKQKPPPGGKNDFRNSLPVIEVSAWGQETNSDTGTTTDRAGIKKEGEIDVKETI